MTRRLIEILSLCLLTASCAIGPRPVAEMPTVPARWVDEADDYAPGWVDHGFSAVDFATPTDGWIAGRRFLLRVKGDDLSVTFIQGTGISIDDIAFSSAGTGWAVGSQVQRGGNVGRIWRYSNERWDEVAPTALWPDWGLSTVRVSTNDGVWFGGSVIQARRGQHRVPASWRSLVLRYDESEWSEPQLPADDGFQVADYCFHTNGDGVFVGSRRVGDRTAPLILHRRAGLWVEEILPEVAAQISLLNLVTCIEPDGAVAAGWMGNDRYRMTEAITVRFVDGQWQQFPLPDAYRRHSVQAVAGASAEDVWLAVECTGDARPCGPRFLHWTGTWDVVPAPPLPEGRTEGYGIRDMQFVSAEEGWAVGSDFGGPGLQHGVIMQYRRGSWRLRQWTWSTLDQPWFGLFGD